MEHTDQDLGDPKAAIALGEANIASLNFPPVDKDRVQGPSRLQDPARYHKRPEVMDNPLDTMTLDPEAIPRVIHRLVGLKASSPRFGASVQRVRFELTPADYGLTSPPSNTIESIPGFEQERRPSVGYASGYGGTTLPDSGADASLGNSNMQLSVPSHRGRLDPKQFYPRSRPKDFFVEGKVFIKLHTEEAGNTADHNSFGFSTVAYEESAYSQLRRFVVVKARPREYYCLCVPITTYSGKGTAKRNIDKSAHAIIYTGSLPPEKTPEEHGMNKTAIKVLPVRQDEKLDPMSRVNLGKTYSIEWNNKVKEIGCVEPKSLVRLISYWKLFINN
ncbi:MAG: hypothetical protein Q9222_004214 [Ikaeria aurantiellina]